MKVTAATNIQKKKRGVQGKIARKRQRENTLANTLKVHAKNIVESTEDEKLGSDGTPAKPLPEKPNIFAGLNIDISKLNKALSTQCVPITKSSIPKHFPKKEKRKLRHEAFLKKIESVAEVRQQKRKKRRQIKKIGDVDMESEVPVAVPDTTPQSIELKPPDKKQKKKEPENVSKKPIPKTKTRIEQEADITDDFSTQELAEMIFMYGRADSDPKAAVRYYSEWFRNRRVPPEGIFEILCNRLRQTGQVRPIGWENTPRRLRKKEPKFSEDETNLLQGQGKFRNPVTTRITRSATRAHASLRDIQIFKEVMSNSVYQSNPVATITNYVLHKVRESIEAESS